ncbi:hypothetical protein BDZ89DRAFT_1072198 [Hymenopellis radicata]|nr:hypothetical protein BDZ89DRAFT_1072198 [Hymenopellis radicata]
MDSIPLLPVLQGLPDDHPAAIYNAAESDKLPLPVWSNGAYDSLVKDGHLPLTVDSQRSLLHKILLYSHSSSVAATSLKLSLVDGAVVRASIQLHESRWIVLIGVTMCQPAILKNIKIEDLTPVGQLIFKYDWASTPLGPLSTWPQSLKSIVSIMLSTPAQCCVFWGPERTLLYNDAWAKGSASKHPQLLGQPGRIAFKEIWDPFSQHCDLVYSGEAQSKDDDLLFFDTAGQPGYDRLTSGHLETYYSWTYIPVRVEDGSVGGIVNNCIETTQKVLSERRMRMVRMLAERTSTAQTTVAFWDAVFDVLRTNERDLPYVLCYTCVSRPSGTESGSNEGGDTNSDFGGSEGSSCLSRGCLRNQLTLVGSIGVEPGHPRASPKLVNISDPGASEDYWPFAAACAQTEPLLAKNPCPEVFESRGWGDPISGAVCITLTNSDGALTGLIIFGLNTRRLYDDDYSGFHTTLVRNLSSSLSAVQSFEQELARADELRTLDRAKTAFFQNVSHELRTPLTLIRGPCDDALRDNHETLDPVNKTRFKLIYRASGRLLRLVNSLMLFSSAEARRLQGHFCPVRLGPVTTDLASLFRSATERAGLDFNVTCGDPNDERVAYVDIGMWEKIVFNLLSNAIKYTKSGFINLNVLFTSSEVILRVQDSGCGIPEDQIELVFSRFHRVEVADGRSHEGTGIGLALTNELVKLHGGTIRIQSTLGRGSVFTVKLPLGYTHLLQRDVHHEVKTHNDDVGSYAATLVEEATSWLGEDSDTASTLSQGSSLESVIAPERFSVLVAEDNADARTYIKSILLTVVSDVVAFPDGQAALDHIHEHGRPDLIVTDVMMPRMNGIQLLAALEGDDDPNVQAIPVIVLSARAGSETDDRSEGHLFQTAVDFLAKPFSSTELISRVQTRLRAVRQQQELERQVRERTKELKVTKQRYQRMSELSPVAIFETEEADRDVITYANERFFTLVGLPRCLPLDFSDVLRRVAPNNHEAAQSAWAEAVNEGKPVHFDFVFANGKNTFVEIISLNDGRLLGTLTDQTEQRRFAAEQLNSERAKADEAVHQRRLQEAFIDIVSHELRNPLSAIIQSAEILAGSVSRLTDIIQSFKGMIDSVEARRLFSESEVELEDARHAVSSVSLCARHQSIIASDILAVSRLDSHLLNIKSITFYLTDELEAILAMYSIQAAAQGIKLNLTTDPDIGRDTCILADPTRFCQILVNLISNSCRILETWDGERLINIEVSLSTTRPFGSMHAQTAEDGSRVWLVVRLSDSGPGIPLDDQARLFTRFNDVNSGNGVRRASSLGGTGLGLYLCKKLAELQGGQIRHMSAPGQGAAFSFFIEARRAAQAGVRRPLSVRSSSPLPRSNTSTPTQKPLNDNPHLLECTNGGSVHVPLSPSFEVPRSTKLILIVEDNLINQRLLQRQLEKARFLTITANNGMEALQVLEATLEDESKIYPSVILMDLEMPILDGLEATRRIREWEKEGKLPASRLPIFAITGNARQGQVDAALGAGMDRVYIKPYKVAEIIEQIDLDGFPQ